MLALSLLAGTVTNMTPTYAAPPSQFADSAFEKVWTRTDLPVQRQSVKRSYYWGPVANTGTLMEDYAEGMSAAWVAAR